MCIPSTDQLLDDLGGAKQFTCLNILYGYFNIAIHPGTIPVTVVRTQFGLYERLVMPMEYGGSPG